MAITEHPALGSVVMCDFSAGFAEPEMVKRRPVVIVSPKIIGRHHLCTVVALSTTAPEPVMQYHCQIDLPQELPDWFEKEGVWVKGDMVASVGFHRLDLVRLGKDVRGRREYCYRSVTDENLRKIRRCVLAGMGMVQLTKHL